MMLKIKKKAFAHTFITQLQSKANTSFESISHNE